MKAPLPVGGIQHRLRHLLDLDKQVRALRAELVDVREALGRIEGRQTVDADEIARAEYKVYSQFGEDGIVQWLTSKIHVERNFFVEFGVEDYAEATTRWLARNSSWRGLVMDGSQDNIARLRASRIYWSNQITAVAAFITAENVQELLDQHGAREGIGLLSIDIDGNDYWVWSAISHQPAIVVIEYNARWGAERSVTVPYQADFQRRLAHWSHVYFGASLAALCGLAEQKGYDFVGCGNAGVNAFFVRSDLRPPTVPRLSTAEGYRPLLVREATDEEGRYLYLDTEKELELISHLPLIEVPGPSR